MVSDSSKKWLARQKKDRFVKMAKEEGLRSRAVYKLRDIQEKEACITPGMHVLELGAAPGSWTNEMRGWVGEGGKIIAVDTLPMQPVGQVTCVQHDITTDSYWKWQESFFSSATINAVVSDIAPNKTGDKRTDQLRQELVCECVCDIAESLLCENGVMLMKTFHGTGFDRLLKRLRLTYKQVKVMKPDASMRSKHEVYLVATGFQNPSVKES